LDVKCKEVLERLSDYVDADERAELCRMIEEHLAVCRGCKIEVDTIKKTILLYHSNGTAEMPVRVSAALQSALAREYRTSRNDSLAD
jgi:predicted anti-sigma-YlaC factor YlaD